MNLKSIIYLAFLLFASFCYCQKTDSLHYLDGKTEKEIQSYQNFTNQKEKLIKKEITNIGNFKGIELQIIKTQYVEDSSSIKVFAFLTEYETFDRISKKTRILDKQELGKLINALEAMNLDLKNSETEIKYKYLTKNRIEFGALVNKQVFYLTMNQNKYRMQDIIHFDKREKNKLLKMLKKAEAKL